MALAKKFSFLRNPAKSEIIITLLGIVAHFAG